MLKCDVLNKTKDSVIRFEDLEVGSTFIIGGGDNFLDSYKWIGMKVVKLDLSDEFSEYYIMDLSDTVGNLYDDIENYNIIRLIDLKVVEDEGVE